MPEHKESVTVTMAQFLDAASAALDMPKPINDHVTIYAGGHKIHFLLSDLEETARMLVSAFYKCYGGWNMEIGLKWGCVFNGKYALTPCS